jgi:hypothetical protein
MPATCLFTGVELTPQTHEEHTIQESLGGRLKSRFVTCDEFNHSSSLIDSAPKVRFEPMLQVLSPLLPAYSQPGRTCISVEGEPEGLILEESRVTRPGHLILERSESGRPTRIAGDNERALRKLAEQVGMPGDGPAVASNSLPTTVRVTKRLTINCWEVEIAALKSILVTFDHLLRDFPTLRFTRFAELQPVRDLIRSAVDQRNIDPNVLRQYSLGLQYEKRGLYKRLRNQIEAHSAETEFEHVVFVAADGPSRTIDAVWLMFGFDPFGFRLCHNWTHEPFAYAFVNPILKNEKPTGLLKIVLGDELLCRPTDRSSVQRTDTKNEDVESVIATISKEHCDATSRAVLLVENRADDYVKDSILATAADAEPKEQSVSNQIRVRLIHLFRRDEDAGFLQELELILSTTADSIPRRLLGERIVPNPRETIDWSTIIGCYRQCLAKLVERFGLPGGVEMQIVRAIEE